MSITDPRHQLDPTHPDYREGLAQDVSREHRLHQVVAGSAFVLALCLLPLAQYFLLSGTTAGEVAGTSVEQTADAGTTDTSDTTRVFGLVADDTATDTTNTVPLVGAACESRKNQDLADLQRFVEGKRKALLTDYELKVQPYKVAMANLAGTADQVAAERASLNGIIDSLYQPYLTQLQLTEDAVAVEQAVITERTCAAE
jgi:hypothetical protein